jgi:hypothetical protein
MKIDDKDTTKIFDLLRKISNADPEAKKEAESFAGSPGGTSSFYVPNSFKIKKVNQALLFKRWPAS